MVSPCGIRRRKAVGSGTAISYGKQADGSLCLSNSIKLPLLLLLLQMPFHIFHCQNTPVFSFHLSACCSCCRCRGSQTTVEVHAMWVRCYPPVVWTDARRWTSCSSHSPDLLSQPVVGGLVLPLAVTQVGGGLQHGNVAKVVEVTTLAKRMLDVVQPCDPGAKHNFVGCVKSEHQGQTNQSPPWERQQLQLHIPPF